MDRKNILIFVSLTLLISWAALENLRGQHKYKQMASDSLGPASFDHFCHYRSQSSNARGWLFSTSYIILCPAAPGPAQEHQWHIN